MAKFSPQDVPNRPGVYIFRNRAGEVIYVGKARSLRKRLSTYFQPSRSRKADPKLRALINSIDRYETLEVTSDAEALLLESRLIKQYHPRYNVDLRDDKRFLHICLDPAEAFPRLTLVRLRKDDNRLYFGPFPRAGVLRQTLDFLSRRFGLRSCTTPHPGPEHRKHCLDHVIRHCLGPCIGQVDEATYREQVEVVCRVLRGESGPIIEELTEEMKAEAAAMRFEKAAELRDIIDNLRSVCAPMRRFTRATLEERKRDGGEGMDALQQALGLTQPPRHIECIDISNISGRLAVGSVVCFREGRPATNEYRRYRVRSETATDDTAMMREVLERRYRRLLQEERPLPDLIVVDGGKGQLHAAIETLAESGMPPVALLGLAKKREEIFLPGRKDPLVLPRHHQGLKLLQALRDEAHRFAISYHRLLRRRRIADSILFEIPGIGRQRCEHLLQALGSVKNIAEASPETIAAAVPGLGLVLATRVRKHLRARLR